MTPGLFTTIAITGFTVAFFHAAIPTHWLPFVLAGRAQHWNQPKTIAIAALAGGGHVLFTIFLGVLVVWFGIELNKKIGDWFPRIAGGVLIVFGLYYIWRQLSGKRHSHAFSQYSHGAHDNYMHHHHDNHDHEHEHHGHSHHHVHDQRSAIAAEKERLAHFEQPPATSDRVAILSLLALLTFSPCEGFLPVYLTGVKYGWIGFVLLSVILTGATIAGMILFTWLTLTGIEKLNLKRLEKFEAGIMGTLLCALGFLIIIFES
jgi:ABC-type nickel/cobalt efflux system permease component RcnA